MLEYQVSDKQKPDLEEVVIITARTLSSGSECLERMLYLLQVGC